MTFRVSGAASLGSTAGVLVDAIEAFNGFNYAQLGFPIVEHRGASQVSTNVPATLYNAAVGAAVRTLVLDPVSRRIVETFTSAASMGGKSGGASINGTYRIPLSVRYQTAASIPVPLLRPLRQYRVDWLARVTTAGPATFEMAVGARTSGVLAAFLNPGVAWAADPAVNGGRWTPRYRLANGAAVLAGPDAGLATAPWTKLSIRYTEGLTPRVEWLANDAPVFALEGDANMITPSALSELGDLVILTGVGVGTIAQAGETRFIVREI